MSFTSNMTNPLPANLLPPPGTNWLAVIDSAVVFLMISATMGAVTIAMLLALLFFSTATLRRKPLFMLNVVALLLGITVAIVNICAEIRILKHPIISGSPQIMMAMSVLIGIGPTLVDSILLLRIYSVFPPRTTPYIQLFFVMGIPILISVARFVNSIIYINSYAHSVHTTTELGSASILIRSHLPCVKIEWFLQVFDNLYVSLIFLSRVYRHGMSSKPQTVSQRITTLFWISVANFVFPVMLGIVQLVIYMAKPNYYLLAICINEANFHLNVIGLVFATIWAAEERWADVNYHKDPSTMMSTIRYNEHHSSRLLQSRSMILSFTSDSGPSISPTVFGIMSSNNPHLATDSSKKVVLDHISQIRIQGSRLSPSGNRISHPYNSADV